MTPGKIFNIATRLPHIAPSVLKDFVTNTPQPTAMFDYDMHCVASSRNWDAEYGLDQINPVGRSHYHDYPEIPERWRYAHRRGMQGEHLRCDKERFVRSDGKVHWQSWEIHPWRQENGEVGGILIFANVLTGQIQAEEQLRLVLQGAGIGTWDRDITQGITFASPGTLRLLGLDPTQGDIIQDEVLKACVHPDDLTFLGEDYSRSLLESGSFRHSFRVIWPDHSIHWLNIRAETDFSEGSRPLRMAGACIDITELQEARISLEQLEKTVEEKTKALTFALNAKADFLAQMSHEIRNPLNIVTILTGLLANPELREVDRKIYLNRITSATNTVTELLNDILVSSKLEAGLLTLESSSFSLNDVLKNVISIFSESAESKGVDLRIPLLDKDQILLGDRRRLQQILVNLVSNAIKFTAQGVVSLVTNIVTSNDHSKTISFAITDSGIGMDAACMEHIFSPYRQASCHSHRQYEGTGLGLFISQRLVKEMGGCLKVQSTEGLGSVFSFALPFKVSEEGVRESQRAEVSKYESLVGLRVLMVDDDVLNLEALGDFLLSHKIRVELAHNGKEALERLKESANSFDMILMDIQMPVMDGIEATKQIRELLGYRDIPIIALTGGVLPHQLQKAIASGITKLLRKPINLDELMAELAIHGDASRRSVSP